MEAMSRQPEGNVNMSRPSGRGVPAEAADTGAMPEGGEAGEEEGDDVGDLSFAIGVNGSSEKSASKSIAAASSW